MTTLERQYIGNIGLKNKILRSLWIIVSAIFFRPLGTKFFNPWRLLLLRFFGAQVKSDSGVYASVKIWAPWNLKLGHNAWLGPHVICYNQALVELEDDVTISQYSYLCSAGHETSELNTNDESLIIAPIIIKRQAWIGTRAFINMGVCIGEGAIVGATASVFKSVEPYTIVGGNPAKFIKERVFTNEKEN